MTEKKTALSFRVSESVKEDLCGLAARHRNGNIVQTLEDLIESAASQNADREGLREQGRALIEQNSSRRNRKAKP